MDRHERRPLDHQLDLVSGGARLKRSPDVTARGFRLEVCAGGVQADANQFDGLDVEHTVRPGIRVHLQVGVGLGGVPFPDRVDGLGLHRFSRRLGGS